MMIMTAAKRTVMLMKTRMTNAQRKKTKDHHFRCGLRTAEYPLS